MYCKFCGNKVDGTPSFCSFCGGKLIDVENQTPELCTAELNVAENNNNSLNKSLKNPPKK